MCGGVWSLPGSRPLAPLGAQERRGAPRAREAREPGSPPARPLSLSGSCQRLGRSPGGAAFLSWQNAVETWRQVTEREARWGLGNQPQAAGDPRPLTTILAPPVEPPAPGGIRPVTRAGTWPLWPPESHEPQEAPRLGGGLLWPRLMLLETPLLRVPPAAIETCVPLACFVPKAKDVGSRAGAGRG